VVQSIPDILARIVQYKRSELRQIAATRPELERRAAQRQDFRDFKAALTSRRPAIIGEIKKASPSKGTFVSEFDPAAIARTYFAGGAAALSVLTDSEFFEGSLRDLEEARRAVSIPVLRKDFTLDECHIIEAAAHGADAILLIAALLDENDLRRFRELAAQHRMAALVEVHERDELDRALASGAEIVGVNNRNLHTFEVSQRTSLELAERIPANVVKVSESGIHSKADVQKLQSAGFQAFLVGEYLMSSADRAQAVRDLLP
jgi:indole-3-glycerol phosphate synthase